MSGHRYTITFRKDGSARFLSHLDLQATLEYAMRRAALPLQLSQGFNPRPRYSLAAALPLGYIGEAERMEVTLKEPLAPEEIVERFQSALPEGLTIIRAEPTPEGLDPAASRLRSASYRVLFPGTISDLTERISALLARDRVEIEEERDGKRRLRDIRPLIISMEAVDERTVLLKTKLTGEGSVRTEEILRQAGLPVSDLTIVRVLVELE